jgi:hypothetical protein
MSDAGDGGGKALARPRPVTVGGILATVTCLLLVVSLFDAMGMVRSSETRDQITEFLSQPPGDSLGMTVGEAVGVLRGLVLVSGALAAAGVVLGVFALQRHRGARLGLSIVAGLLMFTASFTAGFLPVLVAVAATMLWNREARDWFAGRPPVPRPEQPVHRDAATPAGPPPGATTDPWARPFADPSTAGWPPPAPAYGGPAVRPERPRSVVVATWLTWVFAGLTAFLFASLLATVLGDRDRLLATLQADRRIAEAGLTDGQIIGTMWVVSAVGIFWSLAAVALAVLAYHGVNAGRIVLVVSAALSAVPGLIAVPVGWPTAAAAIAVVVLLFRPEANEWYAHHSSGPGAGRPAPPPVQQPRPPHQPPGKPPVW